MYEPKPKQSSKGEVITFAYKKVGQLRLLTVKTKKPMGEYSGEARPAERWIVAVAEVDVDQLD